MDDQILAQQIFQQLKANPSLTVDELGITLGETSGRVASIIDQWLVTDTNIAHAGPGKGGGWLEH